MFLVDLLLGSLNLEYDDVFCCLVCLYDNVGEDFFFGCDLNVVFVICYLVEFGFI